MNNDVIDRLSEKSGERFSSGYKCAESVLMTLAESRSITSPLIPKIATGFCSGVSRTNGTCGAVSGAVMGISLVLGRNDSTIPTDENYAAIQQFIAAFREQFGSVNCGELTGCDLTTEGGRRDFEEQGKREQCLRFVEEATRLALAVLAA